MNQSFTGSRTKDRDDDDRHHNAWFEFRRIVRGTVYLWGSSGLTEDLNFGRSPILQIHNDLFGEQIAVSTQKANGTTDSVGTLQPGECLSIAVDKLSGIFATCTLESPVLCRLR